RQSRLAQASSAERRRCPPMVRARRVVATQGSIRLAGRQGARHCHRKGYGRRGRAVMPRETIVLSAKGIAVALALFAIADGVLRAVGFEFDTVPHRVELFTDGALQNENQKEEVIQRHPSLFWSLVPGATLGNFKVNDAGFIGAMPALSPRPGTHRIVCMGDSN